MLHVFGQPTGQGWNQLAELGAALVLSALEPARPRPVRRSRGAPLGDPRPVPIAVPVVIGQRASHWNHRMPTALNTMA